MPTFSVGWLLALYIAFGVLAFKLGLANWYNISP